MIRYIIFIGCLATILSCKKEDELTEKPLAEAYGEYLLPSDLGRIINADLPVADSIGLANAYIKDWLNNKVVESVAEKNIHEDDNIDRLVEEYRNSLVRHNYEEAILTERLDTFISENEVQRYYGEHFQSHELKERVYSIQFVRFVKHSEFIKDFRKRWFKKKDESYDEALKIASHDGDALIVYEDIWLNIEEVNRLFSNSKKFKATDFFDDMKYNSSDNNYYYYLRVKEVLREGDTTPLQYVVNDIRRILLHHRKNEILEKLTSELLERELKSNKVKLYNVQ